MAETWKKFSGDADTWPQIEPLTSDEREWLDEQRGLLADAIDQLDIELSEDATPLDGADAVIRWWHAQEQDERPDPNIIIMIAGVALGDRLAESFGLEWGIITDESGADLGLYHPTKNVVCGPTHSVAKRFADGSDGFLGELLVGLSEGMEEAVERAGARDG